MPRTLPPHLATDTFISHVAQNPEKHDGAVNIPVYRASTIVFPTLDDYEAAEKGTYGKPTYGRYGSEATLGLEEALARLEGADHAMLTASGVAAITVALLSFVKAGDHILMADTVYGPARRFCNEHLAKLGVETTFFDPLIGSEIRALMKPNTKIVYVESPGSLTFEMMDIPAIAAVAHEKGAIVMADNTWATQLFFKPFEHGIDVSIHSLSKYVSGHSDLIMGVITSRAELRRPLRKTHYNLGACINGDNAYLALRGLRTMSVRLRHHQESAMKVATWLESHPMVERVLYPALPSHEGHAIWKRDMTGACGLFTFLVGDYPRENLAAMLDNMRLTRMGYSWGAFESLLIPFNPHTIRTATQWKHKGINLRLHVGLEAVEDLMQDIDDGLKRLKNGQ
jgi:cystathionine beta-lyase